MRLKILYLPRCMSELKSPNSMIDSIWARVDFLVARRRMGRTDEYEIICLLGSQNKVGANIYWSDVVVSSTTSNAGSDHVDVALSLLAKCNKATIYSAWLVLLR